MTKLLTEQDVPVGYEKDKNVTYRHGKDAELRASVCRLWGKNYSEMTSSQRPGIDQLVERIKQYGIQERIDGRLTEARKVRQHLKDTNGYIDEAYFKSEVKTLIALKDKVGDRE